MKQFDEKQWPELTKFRNACLEDDHNAMQQIADRKYHWYQNENPADLTMDVISNIFKTQWYALTEDLDSLRAAVESNPWTARAWLPISQAASTHGNKVILQYLLDKGAGRLVATIGRS